MTHDARETVPRTIADTARDYAKRGWKPVPVNRKTKKAIGKGWQTRPFDPHAFNGNAQNVAVQLGAASAGLTDVDLDSELAIGLAPSFLPPTDAIFGRRSKPCSHQLYVTDLHKTERKANLLFKDGAAVIVELRIGGNGKSATTVVPPSMHMTGEMVAWVNDGAPARVDGDALKRSVLKLAVACLLKPHYPGQGSRHEGALVLGGVLARAGWTREEIAHLVHVVANAAGDDEIDDRVASAAGAIDVKAKGDQVAGLTRLAELWGEDVSVTLGKWLGGPRALHVDNAAGLEDAVALAFAEQYASDYRYVAGSSQWMHWTGSCWKPENTLAAFDVSRALCRAAGDAKAKTVAAVIALARADRRVAATTDQWNADANIFNTAVEGGS